MCPLCKKEFSDILNHFVLAHNIKDMDHLVQEIEEAENVEKTKIEFRNYVEGLKKKMQEGVMSAEDYRESVMKWCREHEQRS